MESARLTQFEEDLLTLSELLIRSDPLPPRHVRAVGSAIVRKWLIDGNLNQLSQELSVKFEIPAHDTSKVFEEISNNHEVNFFLAGGIYLGGIPVRSIYNSGKPYAGTPPISVNTPIAFYTPGKFLKSKRIFYSGHTFNAEQIITFVANKHGGVHLDSSREKPWHSTLEEAAKYMAFGNPNNEDHARVIEPSESGDPCIIVIPPEKGNLWSCLEIELLSAAQALLSVHCNGEPIVTTKET